MVLKSSHRGLHGLKHQVTGGCIMLHRGCIMLHRGCIMLHRGCILLHRGQIWHICSICCICCIWLATQTTQIEGSGSVGGKMMIPGSYYQLPITSWLTSNSHLQDTRTGRLATGDWNRKQDWITVTGTLRLAA